MDRRLPAILLLAMVAITALAPLSAGGSDAITEDEFILKVPNSGVEDEVPLDIGNGHDYYMAIYMLNESDHPLDISLETKSSKKEVYIVENLEGFMLMPCHDSEHKDMYRQSITVHVDEVCPSYELAAIEIYVNVEDLIDGSRLSYVLTLEVNVISSYDNSSYYNKFFGIFPNDFDPPLNSSFFPFIVTLVVLVVSALLFSAFAVPVIARKLDTFTDGDDLSRFKKILTSLIMVSVVLIFIDPGLRILGTDLSILIIVTECSRATLVVVTVIAIWKLYSLIIEGILTKCGEKEDSTFDLSLLPLFLMIGKLVLWISSTALILALFGVDLQGILVSAGIVSLGITLGAQNVLSQFFSGLVLLITRPFDVGDHLEINGRVVRVKKVKVMFTEFLSRYDDRVIVMPNNAVTSATIVNYDKDDNGYYLQITIPVPYGTDLKKAREIILKVANESPDTIHDPEFARRDFKLKDFQDSSLLLELGVKVPDFNGSFTNASNLRIQMYEALKAEGIEVPFNKLEVTMLNDCFNKENGRW